MLVSGGSKGSKTFKSFTDSHLSRHSTCAPGLLYALVLQQKATFRIKQSAQFFSICRVIQAYRDLKEPPTFLQTYTSALFRRELQTSSRPGKNREELYVGFGCPENTVIDVGPLAAVFLRLSTPHNKEDGTNCDSFSCDHIEREPLLFNVLRDIQNEGTWTVREMRTGKLELWTMGRHHVEMPAWSFKENPEEKRQRLQQYPTSRVTGRYMPDRKTHWHTTHRRRIDIWDEQFPHVQPILGEALAPDRYDIVPTKYTPIAPPLP
jgi:hypothetical protein